MITKRRLRGCILIASILVFGRSVFTPCYYTHIYHGQSPILDPTFGIEALLFGWVEIFDSGYSAWLANPLWLISCILLLARSKMYCRLVAVLALAVSLSFLLYDVVLVNEAGSKSEIIRYGIGYWLWVASFVLLCAATAIGTNDAPRNFAGEEPLTNNARMRYFFPIRRRASGSTG